MFKSLFKLIIFTPLIVSQYLHADAIYVYKEKGGSIKFTSKPPPTGIEATVFTAKGIPYSIIGPRKSKPIGHKLFLSEHSEIINKVSNLVGIEAALIRAVIHAESAFDRYAVSNKGARGLMQLMPEVAKEWGVKNVFDPAQNILAGSRLLVALLNKYAGNIKLALAAYNAGAGAVEKYGGIPPYTETREYIQKVIALKIRYASHKFK